MILSWRTLTVAKLRKCYGLRLKKAEVTKSCKRKRDVDEASGA